MEVAAVRSRVGRRRLSGDGRSTTAGGQGATGGSSAPAATGGSSARVVRSTVEPLQPQAAWHRRQFSLEHRRFRKPAAPRQGQLICRWGRNRGFGYWRSGPRVERRPARHANQGSDTDINLPLATLSRCQSSDRCASHVADDQEWHDNDDVIQAVRVHSRL